GPYPGTNNPVTNASVIDICLGADGVQVTPGPPGHLMAVIRDFGSNTVNLISSYTGTNGAWHYFNLAHNSSVTSSLTVDDSDFVLGTNKVQGKIEPSGFQTIGAERYWVAQSWIYAASIPSVLYFDGAIDEIAIYTIDETASAAMDPNASPTNSCA